MYVCMYIFSISPSWLALRSQVKDLSCNEGTLARASTAPAVSSSLGDSSALSEWCVGADDWGTDEEGEEESGEGEASWGEGGEMEREVECGEQEGEEMEEEHLKPRAEGHGKGEKCLGLSEGTGLNELHLGSGGQACTVALATSETQCEERLNGAEADSLVDEVTALTLSSEQTDSGHGSFTYQGPHFGSFYVNVLNEPLAEEKMVEQVEKLLQRYGGENMEEWRDARGEDYERNGKRKQSRGGGSGAGAGGKRGADKGERYEKAVAKHGDRMFQKFHKVMSRCPHQILR